MNRTNSSSAVFAKAIGLVGLAASLMGASRGQSADAAFTEYHVKALFLYNFAKYVDWPANVFPETNTPITVGVVGRNDLGGDLKTVVEGKSIDGRRIVVLHIEKESDWNRCQILFISASEDGRIAEILDKVKTLPILTVGESDPFVRQGGIIHFINKEGKIRLGINLQAAREVKLQISSKLLSVADIVKGRSN